jgi:hypothetical protein
MADAKVKLLAVVREYLHLQIRIQFMERPVDCIILVIRKCSAAMAFFVFSVIQDFGFVCRLYLVHLISSHAVLE